MSKVTEALLRLSWMGGRNQVNVTSLFGMLLIIVGLVFVFRKTA
jgi:hypothetical protein